MNLKLKRRLQRDPFPIGERMRLARETEMARPFVDGDCAGEGKCHGCLQWCDHCGDVDEMCDATPCDQHRCQDCHAIFTYREREWLYEQGQMGGPGRCYDCEVAAAMREAVLRIAAATAAEDPMPTFNKKIDQVEDEIQAGERRRAELAFLRD